MYHIGVGLEVVRFDKMGLPGPQLVKRATGKFTLTFYCLLTNCFTLKVRGMVQKKIPFESVLAENAIAAYLRKNASYISFVGEVNDVDSVMSAQIGSITCLEGKNHYAFRGIARLKYQLDDGMMECCYNISASCTMVMDEEDEIVIKDMSVINVISKR